MRVETTGLIFEGRCAVQTEVCRAREIGSLTAVTTPDGEQIDVCGACLQRMSESRAWHIPGTRPRPRPLARAETRQPTPLTAPPA
jgi:hypothetical protein